MTKLPRRFAATLLAGGLALGLPFAAAAQSAAQGDGGPAMHLARAGHSGIERDGHGAAHGGHRGTQRRGGPMAMLRGIDLSEAQRDQVFAIVHGGMPAMREQMKQMRIARKGLRELGRAGTFDEAKARSLAEASGKAVAEMSFLRAQNASRILAVLTPEQRAKLEQRRNRFEEHRKQRG